MKTIGKVLTIALTAMTIFLLPPCANKAVAQPDITKTIIPQAK